MPLPDGCSIEQAKKAYTDEVSEQERVRFTASMERLTGKLRRPGRITSDSERAGIYRERGLWHAWLGNPEPALADYQHAIELDPRQIATYAVRVVMFGVAECLEYAREDLASIQNLYMSSEDGQGLLNSASQLRHASWEFDEPVYLYAAIDVARRAAHWLVFPYEAEVLQGVALASLGRLPEALVVLSSSIESYRIGDDGHYYRGLVNRRLGHTEAAIADFENAILRERDSARARAALGITFVESGQVSEGLQTLNDAVLLDAANSYARQWRGQVLLGLGEAEAARADFERAILNQAGASIGPDFADPYVGLAAAELALGNRRMATLALAEAQSRQVSWINEPTISKLRTVVERELAAR